MNYHARFVAYPLLSAFLMYSLINYDALTLTSFSHKVLIMALGLISVQLFDQIENLKQQKISTENSGLKPNGKHTIER